jgi:hypothetical protein
MIKSSNIKQQYDILGRLDSQIMAYGSIVQVHSEVSAAICNVKARNREQQIREMPDAQKKEFLDIRAKNVRIGTETNEELKRIREQLQKQAPEGVPVDKYAIKRAKYAEYARAGFRTKHFLNKIERCAFSLLKQNPEKTVIQPNGCITIRVEVLREKVKELEDERKARK